MCTLYFIFIIVLFLAFSLIILVEFSLAFFLFIFFFAFSVKTENDCVKKREWGWEMPFSDFALLTPHCNWFSEVQICDPGHNGLFYFI